MTLGYSIAPVQRGLVEPRFNRFVNRIVPLAPPSRFPPPAAPPPPRYVAPRITTYGERLKREDELRRLRAVRATPTANTAWYANMMQRRADFQRREFERLLQTNARLSREQAALMAQQAAAQQIPATPPPMAPVSVPSSPAAPGADMTPAQEAHDPGGDDGGGDQHEASHPHNKHLFLFLGIAAAAGVGGYVLLKKKKTIAKS